MAAKIYDVPDEIKVPTLNFRDIEQYRKDCKQFEDNLKDWCIKRMERANISDKYVGEIIDFPVADGRAEYMVAALKPIQLIHIPLWDAWDFQYAKNLTKKDIIAKIENKKAIAEMIERNRLSKLNQNNNEKSSC